MNKIKANSIGKKVLKFLKEIEKEEGITFSLSGSSFSSNSMTISIQGKESNDSNVHVNLDLSKRYGFSQNIVGMEFTCPNGTFVVDGFKTQNRKYPIIATRKGDGASWKFHPSNVLKYIGGNKIVNRNANLTKLLGQM